MSPRPRASHDARFAEKTSTGAVALSDGRGDQEMSAMEAAELLGVQPGEIEAMISEAKQPSDKALAGEEVPQ